MSAYVCIAEWMGGLGERELAKRSADAKRLKNETVVN